MSNFLILSVSAFPCRRCACDERGGAERSPDHRGVLRGWSRAAGERGRDSLSGQSAATGGAVSAGQGEPAAAAGEDNKGNPHSLIDTMKANVFGLKLGL